MPHKKVFVLPGGSPAARRNLVDVLGRLECLEVADDIGDADVVIVLMGGSLPDDEALRAVLSPAADGAFKLVGVHALDGDGTIPVVLEDWATGGFYPLDEQALRTALCDEEEGWFDPAGGLRPQPATKRECAKHNC